jgi:hypothetical protein
MRKESRLQHNNWNWNESTVPYRTAEIQININGS